MVVGSLLSSRRIPRDVGATMLRLHAPESLRL
jgi:cation/acetate symporter